MEDRAEKRGGTDSDVLGDSQARLDMGTCVT